jgi:arginine-tRNA-protein transferase
MTSDNEKPIDQLRLYATAPHPCSYLDEEASTLFIDPEADIDHRTFSYLNERGFRRSGQHIYKPNCLNCQACLSYRVIANSFKASKSQRRIFNKNKDVKVTTSSNILSSEHYLLYESYINIRHKDGDMYPANQDQYESFLGNHIGHSLYLEARIDGQLVAVAMMDDCINGLSAVYTFFDPTLDNRSLGQFMILEQIEWVKRSAHFKYLYLGYWVKNSPKMIYKSKYQPGEIYFNKRWIPLTL